MSRRKMPWGWMDGWMDGHTAKESNSMEILNPLAWVNCSPVQQLSNCKVFTLSWHPHCVTLKKTPQNHTSTTNPKPNFISNNNTVNRLQWIQFNSCIRSVFWLPGWRMQNSYPGKIHSIFEAIDAIPQAVATNPPTTTTTITTVNANVCGVGRKTASSIPWRRLGVNDLGNVQMSEWTT